MSGEIALSDQENQELEQLTKQAQRNSIEAQKFAIEAAKLLSVTTDRLKDYKDRGFFKRCWYAVSGKTGELERANQSDLIKMQKFAWTYLAKLQEQNLLQAKAIAVIRNNLKELQDEIGELSDQISVIVDKFDARLTDLEGTSALHDWLLHLKLNDSFDRNTKFLCFLQIVFDCLSVMRKNHIGFEKANMRDDIDAALLQFDIKRDESMTVDEFVTGLYGEVAKVGMERLKSVIDISIDGEILPPSYMLDNFSGTGCNALYGFELEMERNENVAKQIQDENARNAIRLAAVKAVMTNGSARFTFSELGREIVGACLMAEDFYRSEHGGDMGDMLGLTEGPADDGFDMGSILDNCAELKRHSFLDSNPNDEEKHAYLESFALVFASMGGFRDCEYLTALAKLFGCEECVECVKNVSAALLSNPRSVNAQVQGNLKVMNDDQRRYSWALDAFMLGCVEGEVHAKVKSGVKTVLSKAFHLPESTVDDYLTGIETLVTQKDAEVVKNAIGCVSAKTQNWAAIAKFRGLELSGDVGDKSVSISSTGDVEVVGLKFEQVKTVPFLEQDIETIISFKGSWYVAESCKMRLWKSSDGFNWVQVGVPEQIEKDTNPHIAVAGDYLFYWDVYGRYYGYTQDGVNWGCGDFGETLNFNYKKFDFSYLETEDKWLLHIHKSTPFNYEDGVIFKTTQTSYYDKSIILTSPRIDGKWIEDDKYKFLDDVRRGHHIVADCPLCCSDKGLIALTDMDISYSYAFHYSGNFAHIYTSKSGSKKFEESSIDTPIQINTSQHTYEIKEIDGGYILYGCEGAVYFSQTGQSWRKVFDKTLDVKMTKVGKYYCSFISMFYYNGEDPGYMVITADGIDFKKIAIDHVPCRACFNGDKVFLIDRCENGGLFVGKVEIEQA